MMLRYIFTIGYNKFNILNIVKMIVQYPKVLPCQFMVYTVSLPKVLRMKNKNPITTFIPSCTFYTDSVMSQYE